MNIASPTAPTAPTTGRVDAAAGPGRTDVASTRASTPVATDAAVPPGGKAPLGFGEVLAQQMSPGDTTKDLATDGTPTIPSTGHGSVLIGPDGVPVATTNPMPISLTPDTGPADDGLDAPATDVASTPKPTTVIAAPPSVVDDTSPKPATRDTDDAVGDLAAQLALVSQWAALAQPAVTPAVAGDAEAPAAGGDAKAGGPDLQRKLDIVRAPTTPAGPASTTDVATATAATNVAGQAAVTDKVTTAAATTGTFAAGLFAAAAVPITDRGARTSVSTAPSAPTAVTAPTDLRKSDATTASDRAAVPDALTGKLDAIAPRAASEVTAFANTLVAQVTAQVSNAQAAAVAATPQQALREAVGTPAWSHEVGQATLRMAVNDLQGASLRLNPEHLGPLDVQVRVDNGVAHLNFVAAHAETRQAIEASRTTLDQLFADQGLKIGDCAVGDSSSSPRRFDADAAQQGASSRAGDRRAPADTPGGDATTTVTTTVRRALGLVDTFA